MTTTNEHSEPGQPLGLALTEGLGLVERLRRAYYYTELGGWRGPEVDEDERWRAVAQAAERALSTQPDWLHLEGYGYAPGNYMSRCHRCGQTPIMDKRAITCRPCAELLHAEANAPKALQAAQPAARKLDGFGPNVGGKARAKA